MKVYEFEGDSGKVLTMFQCAAEPWWAFRESAEAAASAGFHVYFFAADGHDETGTDFVSVEKYAADAAAYLRGAGVEKVDCMYGVSMGGAAVMRFLATEDIPVRTAVIDAGITPYPYPRIICRLIAAKDWLTTYIGAKCYPVMKAVMPPERWTPKGQDPEEHYRRIYEFEKNHFSSRSIYNVFWSANNYSMPDPVPQVSTVIEYWYGGGEKKARKDNISYVKRAFPQTEVREFGGLAHGELVMMFPERFRDEIVRITEE